MEAETWLKLMGESGEGQEQERQPEETANAWALKWERARDSRNEKKANEATVTWRGSGRSWYLRDGKRPNKGTPSKSQEGTWIWPWWNSLENVEQHSQSSSRAVPWAWFCVSHIIRLPREQQMVEWQSSTCANDPEDLVSEDHAWYACSA